VFHDDPVYLADIHDLQSYVRSELNIQDIAFPKSDHIKYSVAADFAVLGRKLKNDVHRVKNALPNLSSHQVKVFMKIGTIKVDGIELVAGDLVLSRYVDLPPNGGFDSNTDNDVVVALDVQRHVELEGAALARDLVSKVQKLRKGASLQPTDDVDIFYHFEEGDSTVLEAAILSHADFITSALRSELKKEKVPRLPRSAVVIDEEQMIGDVKTRLSLVRR
jgi:isoleucyl-tRNA synthetase